MRDDSKSVVRRREKFLARVKEEHPGWEAVNPLEFQSSRATMLFRHIACGNIVSRSPHQLLNTGGCSKCYHDSLVFDNNRFAEKAREIHGDAFDYSKVEYVDNKTVVLIFCKRHSIEFWQEPRNHWIGHGCEECRMDKIKAATSHTKEEFVAEANRIHGSKYGYDRVEYANNNTQVEIFCADCNGHFWQLPRIHTAGHGCPTCNVPGGSVSNVEIRWLDILKVPQQCRQQVISANGRAYKVDAYDDTKNTVYEFYGDFWHGNPDIFDQDKTNAISNKSFGELYQATTARQDQLVKLGHEVVYIWENEFYKQYGRKTNIDDAK